MFTPQHVCYNYRGIRPYNVIICIPTGSVYTILIKGFISEHQRMNTMLRSLIRYPQYYCYFCRRLIYERPLLLGHYVLCCQFLFGTRRHCANPSGSVQLGCLYSRWSHFDASNVVHCSEPWFSYDNVNKIYQYRIT